MLAVGPFMGGFHKPHFNEDFIPAFMKGLDEMWSYQKISNMVTGFNETLLFPNTSKWPNYMDIYLRRNQTFGKYGMKIEGRFKKF